MAKDEEVWWMANGNMTGLRRKKSILQQLSDNIVSVDTIQGIVHIFAKSREKPLKYILLCEGRDDVLNLKKALNNAEINIIDCTSATCIDKFIDLPYNTQDKAIILCLFDYDDTGIIGEGKVQDKLKKEKKPFNNIVKTLFVSKDKGDRMEEVLKDELKKKNLLNNINNIFFEVKLEKTG